MEGYGEGGWVIDIGEDMCYGECCEVCKLDDSQTCTPGAKNTFYVYKKIKNKLNKKLFKRVQKIRTMMKEKSNTLILTRK